MKQGRACQTAVGLFLICSLLCSPALFAEVYSWTDENGVKHFSQIPPGDEQETSVLELPDPDTTSGADLESGTEAEVPGFETREDNLTDDSEALSAADKKRLEIAEAREQMRKEQAEQELACENARERLAQVEPSPRVFYTNEAGETVRMDDEQRVATVEELHAFIDSNCN